MSAGKSSALGLFRFIARCLLRGGDIGRHHLLTDVVTVESSLSKGHGMLQQISHKARKRQRGGVSRFLSLYKSCCYSAYRHQPPPSLPRRITHPDLPQRKEQVTLPIVISPHLTSPEGEGQIVLVRLKQVDKQDSA